MTHKGLAQLILAWAKSTFGEVASDPIERAARCLEEAAEVAQGGGVSFAMAMMILQRTYSRPPDTVEKEIGGLLVTVYALCAVKHLDPQECLETEVARVLAKDPSMWRKKHNDKVEAGTSTARADGPTLLLSDVSEQAIINSCQLRGTCTGLTGECVQRCKLYAKTRAS